MSGVARSIAPFAASSVLLPKRLISAPHGSLSGMQNWKGQGFVPRTDPRVGRINAPS